MTPRPPTAIELFSGCGGMSTGLLDAGVAVLSGFDSDRRSVETFDYNHAYRGAKGFVRDLSTATGRELLDAAGSDGVDLVAGGPPCQPFSIAGKRLGLDDRRGNLVFDFVRLVAEIQPRAVLFENVPNLASVQDGSVVADLDRQLRALGYATADGILNAADYGVPQFRRRFVLAGAKLESGKALPFPPPPTHAPHEEAGLFGTLPPYVTCEAALGDLPDVGEERARSVHNHEPTIHGEAMLRAFAALPQGKRDPKSYHDRLHAGRPGYTLRAGSGNFSPLRPVHYRHDRVITVRESARLQGFDDSFIWPDWVPRLQQYRQVGNAVPPLLARRVVEALAPSLGWSLVPDALRGDPGTRPEPCRSSYEDRAEERMRRLRGASLGRGRRTA